MWPQFSLCFHFCELFLLLKSRLLKLAVLNFKSTTLRSNCSPTTRTQSELRKTDARPPVRSFDVRVATLQDASSRVLIGKSTGIFPKRVRHDPPPHCTVRCTLFFFSIFYFVMKLLISILYYNLNNIKRHLIRDLYTSIIRNYNL